MLPLPPAFRLAPRAPPTGDASRARWVLSTFFVVLAVGSLLVPFGQAVRAATPPSPSGVVTLGGAPASSCALPGTTSPSSLLIPLTQPTGSLGANVTSAVLGATLEFRGTNGSSLNLPGLEVHIPTTNANFYLQGGSKIQLHFFPRNASIPPVGWSSPFTASHSLSPSATFTTGSATLSTAWLAVTVNASYGSVQLEFRWQWWIRTTGGNPGTHTGPWSSAVTTSSTHAQPTTFYPAPWVGVSATAGPKMSSGSTYWMLLNGNVSSTNFRVVVETATGHEVNSVCRTTTSGASSFNATVPLTYITGGSLPRGSYVIHAHNAGAAVVVFETVVVT